jgi:hypothetical protein
MATKRRHSEEEILRVLRDAESADSIVEVCRRHGISQQTFQLWTKIRGSRSAFDDLPALDWIDFRDDRAFYSDAFLSHRQGDASVRLAKLLQEYGIRAWHDGDADLSDRVVRKHISHAIGSSRIVLVCLTSAGSSNWMRAEYEPALRLEQIQTFTRVAVALITSDVLIPPELDRCPCFEVATQIEELASFLHDANRLCFRPKDLAEVADLHVDTSVLQREIENVGPNPHELVVQTANLARIILERDLTSSDIYYELLPLVCKLEDNPSVIKEIGLRGLSLLRSFAMFTAKEGGTDARADGLRILGCLTMSAEGGIDPMYFVRTVASEPDRAVASTVYGVLAHVRDSLPAEAQCWLELIALNDPDYFRLYDRSTTAHMSAMVRCRILTCTESLGKLPFEEKLLLSKQRLDALNAASKTTAHDWECWARDLFAGDLRILPGGWTKVEGGINHSSAYQQSFADLLVCYVKALVGHGDIVAGLAPCEIVDYVFYPLAWLQCISEYAAQSRCLYATVCRIIAEHSPHGYGVPSWLVLPERLLTGDTLGQAIGAMHEAIDKMNQQVGLIRSIEAHEAIDELKLAGVKASKEATMRWCGAPNSLDD